MNLTPLQELWLQRLENGRHVKLVGQLGKEPRTTGFSSFCCLGVACQVYYDSRVTLGLDPISRYVYDNKTIDFGGTSIFLPTQITKALNMHGELGQLIMQTAHYPRAKLGGKTGPLMSLSEMNDNGWSHPEIAAFIRENPNAVFKNIFQK